MLSGKQKRRIENALRRIESQPTGPRVPPPGAILRQVNWQFVRITGAAVDSGDDPDRYYPCVVTIPTEDDDDWVDEDGECWARCSSGMNLAEGEEYAARQTNDKILDDEESSRPVFVVGTSGLPCSNCIQVVTDVDCVDDELVIVYGWLRLTSTGLQSFESEEDCDAAEGC